jgi:WD40 repeat protein
MRNLLTLLLVLITTITFSQTYKKGDKIEILWENHWYPGLVEEVKGDKYVISYDGYGADWNETVGIDRMKSSTSTDQTPTVKSSYSFLGVETIHDLDQSPDGKYILATSAYSKLYILNASDLTLVSEIKVSKNVPFTGTWSQDGDYIATGDYNGKTIIYKRKEGTEFTEIDSLTGYSSISKMRFSPVNNNLLISAAPKDDYTKTIIDVWDLKTKKIKYNVLKSTNAEKSIGEITWSNDGSKIAVAISNKKHGIEVYDSTGKLSFRIEHKKDVVAVSFSPDGGNLASGGTDCALTLWNLTTKKAIWTKPWSTDSDGYVYAVAFAPNGSSIAVAGRHYGKPIKIYDSATGSIKNELGETNPLGNALVFSPDSKSVTVGNTTYGDIAKVGMVKKYVIPE